MARAVYWQKGESLDYVNETTAVIEANTIIPLEGRIGVAGTSINPGETGSLYMAGVYEIAKTGRAEIKMGAAVYFDGTGITDTKADAVPAGYAARTAAAEDEVILVKLPG
ncbi:MAG: DUF2190 family protein [Lachnospiraceae bacterium]|nr:DUF2190 family protein [Lachnospiraceae bacterium]